MTRPATWGEAFGHVHRARRRLDPQDPSTPQAASASQLRELIRRAFHEDTGHWPVSVTLAVVRYKQRFRFHVVTYEAAGGGGLQGVGKRRSAMFVRGRRSPQRLPLSTERKRHVRRYPL